jgi:hypothetical protein
MQGHVFLISGAVGSVATVVASVWHPLLQLLLQGEHIHQIMHGMHGWQGLHPLGVVVSGPTVGG